MTNLLSLPILPTDHWRPKTRGDCVNEPRPCPYVGCVHHLYLTVKKNGTIVLNFPGIEPEDMKESCVLDIADGRPASLKRTGEALGMTKEGARLYEVSALRKLLKNGKSLRVFR